MDGKLPMLAIKKQDVEPYQHQAIWVTILDTNAKEIMECVQLDLTNHELKNIWSIKFSKNSSIDKNS